MASIKSKDGLETEAVLDPTALLLRAHTRANLTESVANRGTAERSLSVNRPPSAFFERWQKGETSKLVDRAVCIGTVALVGIGASLGFSAMAVPGSDTAPSAPTPADSPQIDYEFQELAVPVSPIKK